MRIILKLNFTYDLILIFWFF